MEPPASPPPPQHEEGAAADACPSSSSNSGGEGMLLAQRLNEFFTCPQCKGYFRDPHVAICCLTTFCRDCIVRVLRTVAASCPCCGQYLGATLSQRVRPDPQLQAIMLKLFPDIYERERACEAAFWRDRAARGEEEAVHPQPPKDRVHSGGPTTSSGFAAATAKWLPPADRAEAAAVTVAQRATTTAALEELAEDSSDDERLTTPLHLDMVVLCTPQPPQPDDGGDDAPLPPLPLPYLKLQRRTQVGRLGHVLAEALGLGDGHGDEALEIMCRGQVLMAQHSLHFVDRIQWRTEPPPLHLHYRRRRSLRRQR